MSNIESYPFSERPGEEIGQGYVSRIKELGPDWVVKEFNPVKPDGTVKDEWAYERTQNPKHIRELQETQRILSQDFIYGDKIIPTYWVLGSDENGKEKYFTVQKRFNGKTLLDLLEEGDHALRYNQRFTEYFNENRELRAQMLELMWGTKRALVETGVFDDFHVGNIAVTIEPGNKQKLKVFDIQNMIRSQKILYGDTSEPLESKKHILENIEKHSSRLEKFEKWLGVTEEEKNTLDKKFGIEGSKYENALSTLKDISEKLIPDYSKGEKDIASEVLTQISATYPFLNKEEYNAYMEKATNIEPDIPIREIQKLIKLLDNPHATVNQVIHVDYSENINGRKEKDPSSELKDNILYMHLPSMLNISEGQLEDLFNRYEDKSEGLIIDIRGNSGGNELPARQFAEKYLIKEGRHNVGVNVRIAPENGLKYDQIWANSENQVYYDKPIVILTSNKTFSAAERFTSLMKAGTDCILIGTETAGGSANPIETEIEYGGKHFMVYIPTWRYFLKGKDKPIEETKIKPDIYYDKEDIVDYAIKYIKDSRAMEK